MSWWKAGNSNDKTVKNPVGAYQVLKGMIVLSRSYKKHPVIKDNGVSHKSDKQILNRRLRHLMNAGKLDIELEGKNCHYRRLVGEQYDLCDWYSRESKDQVRAEVEETRRRYERMGTKYYTHTQVFYTMVPNTPDYSYEDLMKNSIRSVETWECSLFDEDTFAEYEKNAYIHWLKTFKRK